MGKKVMMRSQANSKKHLNKLIKLLKPKVYITDSSNFKNLVQQLTGNGSNIGPIISSPPPPKENSQEVTIDSSSEGSQEQMDFSEEYKRIESWLLENVMESSYSDYNYNYLGYDHVPLVQEQLVSLYDCDYDLSNLL